jgi:uncharacterized membrane protein
MTAEYRITTAVNASAEEVWGLFIDVERWPTMIESHESVRRLDCGPLQVGSEAIVKQPRLPQARWKVTQLQSGRCFAWETASPGVTSAGGHLVEPHGQGAMITLTLRQHGPLARLAQVLLGRRIRRYLSMEMEGFRRTAESVPG